MKPLPKKINKSLMIDLYANQMSTKNVLNEIRSFQEQCGFSTQTRILHERVKKLFFARFGLPTGYTMPEETKI